MWLEERVEESFLFFFSCSSNTVTLTSLLQSDQNAVARDFLMEDLKRLLWVMSSIQIQVCEWVMVVEGGRLFSNSAN